MGPIYWQICESFVRDEFCSCSIWSASSTSFAETSRAKVSSHWTTIYMNYQLVTITTVSSTFVVLLTKIFRTRDKSSHPHISMRKRNFECGGCFLSGAPLPIHIVKILGLNRFIDSVPKAATWWASWIQNPSKLHRARKRLCRMLCSVTFNSTGLIPGCM